MFAGIPNPMSGEGHLGFRGCHPKFIIEYEVMGKDDYLAAFLGLLHQSDSHPLSADMV